MMIPVLVQPVSNNGFRAEGGAPFSAAAEGATREEALDKLRQAIKERLASGAELTYLDLREPENPWMRIAGIYENDPYLQDYLQAIEDYRRQVDEDPERP